jgi:hypothetical protein
VAGYFLIENIDGECFFFFIGFVAVQSVEQSPHKWKVLSLNLGRIRPTGVRRLAFLKSEMIIWLAKRFVYF